MMSVYEFGRALLDANDLDPVYVVVHHAELPPTTLRRWLLAYWCFYHVGTASWCAEGGDGFWGRMTTAAASKDYPRSSERRHFRGRAAVASVAYLSSRGEDGLFCDLEDAGPTAAEVTAAVREWVGFGPWIAFKVADMLERLGVRPVVFDAKTALYDGSPQEAAALLYERERPADPPPTSPATRQAVARWAADRVLTGLGGYAAPPTGDRPLGFQEAETVLCKWKSYLGGHYHVGEDVEAVRRGLIRFSRCKLSQRLLKAGGGGRLW